MVAASIVVGLARLSRGRVWRSRANPSWTLGKAEGRKAEELDGIVEDVYRQRLIERRSQTE